MKYKNLFVIEGPDGAGKTTTLRDVSHNLTKHGVDHIIVSETAGSPLRDASINSGLSRKAQILAFMAMRQEAITTRVLPALADKRVVLLDRYVWSTLVYQKVLPHGDLEFARAILHFLDFPQPTRTILLDCSVDECMRRLQQRGDMDEIDRGSREFHYQIHDAYRVQAITDPDGYTLTKVHERTQSEITDELLQIIIGGQ